MPTLRVLAPNCTLWDQFSFGSIELKCEFYSNGGIGDAAYASDQGSCTARFGSIGATGVSGRCLHSVGQVAAKDAD